MIVELTTAQFCAVFPRLLTVWPSDGRWTDERRLRLAEILADLPDDSTPPLHINGRIGRRRLAKTGRRIKARTAALTQIPWKYQKYLQRGTPMRQQAIKLRPGANIPLTIGNVPTSAYVNKVRRISKSGKPYYLKADLTINTEHVPIILERESKCDCLYCGTRPKGDETSCLSCGAPLPDC